MRSWTFLMVETHFIAVTALCDITSGHFAGLCVLAERVKEAKDGRFSCQWSSATTWRHCCGEVRDARPWDLKKLNHQGPLQGLTPAERVILWCVSGGQRCLLAAPVSGLLTGGLRQKGATAFSLKSQCLVWTILSLLLIWLDRWLQCRQGGGGGNLLGNIYEYIYIFLTPKVLRVKVTPSSTHYLVYYRCCFYCVCPNPLAVHQKTFSSLVFSSADGCWWRLLRDRYLFIVLAVDLLWCTAISVWQSVVFSQRDCPWWKAEQVESGWCDQLVDLFRLERPCFSQREKESSSEWKLNQLKNKQTQFDL